MIPKIIHFCWFGGGVLPKEHQSYIDEWSELHPGWEIKRWDESTFPVDHLYLKTALDHKNWANASNYARLKVLFEHGGIYLDTDVKVLKPLDALLEHECFIGFESGEIGSEEFAVNNAVAGSMPKHPFIEKCLSRLLEMYTGEENSNLSSPVLATAVLKEEFGLAAYGEQTVNGIKIFEKSVFYALPFDKVYDAEHLSEYVNERSFAVHIWGRSWYSKYDLLQRIDSQAKFIEERLSYIQNLEETIQTHHADMAQKEIVETIAFDKNENYQAVLEELASVKSNQDTLLHSINSKFLEMENRAGSESSKRMDDAICTFLANRLESLENKVMDVLVDSKFESKINQESSLQLGKMQQELDGLKAANASVYHSLESVNKRFDAVVKELEEGFAHQKQQYMDSLSAAFKDALAQQLQNDAVFPIALGQASETAAVAVQESSSLQVKGAGLKADVPLSNGVLLELAELRRENAQLKTENNELQNSVDHYKEEVASKSGEWERANFKVLTLTSYIDNFSQVRKEYEQRIHLLEDLVQKMRLKNRVKRAAGLFKSNNK